jgi:hypothetical protein
MSPEDYAADRGGGETESDRERSDRVATAARICGSDRLRPFREHDVREPPPASGFVSSS